MTVNEILARLKALGDDARRKHNTKAGAPDNQFGVKLGDIRAMAKKIKSDHELALDLSDTGNVEAQLLATLIIKPTSLSAGELDKLTRSTTCAQVAEWLNAYVVAQHPEKEALRRREDASRIFGADERRKGGADNGQTEFLHNEFCAHLSAVHPESREKGPDEGGS